MKNNLQTERGTETELYSKARAFGSIAHKDTNCTYDGFDYSVHLLMVAQVAKEYKHLLSSPKIMETAMCACWLHDVIEDCRVTYNDLLKKFDEEIADCVFALTQNKGRNRKERLNAGYYFDIFGNEAARFVKICDRIANATYSKETKSRMLDVYRKEQDFFLLCLQRDNDPFIEMFAELNKILQEERDCNYLVK